MAMYPDSLAPGIFCCGVAKGSAHPGSRAGAVATRRDRPDRRKTLDAIPWQATAAQGGGPCR